MKEVPSFLKPVFAVDHLIKYVEMFLVGGSTLTMAFVLAGNFIGRNLFHHSWLFAEEVGGFMLIIQTFAGMALCTRLGRHIRMSAVFDLLPVKIRRGTMIMISIVTLGILILLGIFGVQWVMRTYVNGKVSSVLRFPLWIVYLSVPFGCFMSAFQYVVMLLKNITDKENIWVGTEATDAEAD